MTLATVEAIVAMCRMDPQRTQIRLRINNNPFEVIGGAEFLDLWDQPFAGTIDVDALYLDNEPRLERVRG